MLGCRVFPQFHREHIEVALFNLGRGLFQCLVRLRVECLSRNFPSKVAFLSVWAGILQLQEKVYS